MNRYFAYARVLASGAPLGGATITVYDVGTFALIYDDDLPTPTAKANPFIADGNGYFFFYAAAGRYDIRIEGGSIAHDPYTWGDVVVTDVHAQEHVLATSTALGPDHTVSGLTAGHTVSGLTAGHVLTAVTATTARFEALPAVANDDHGLMTGLLDDDHPQFALLAGRFGGQDLYGGSLTGEVLTLRGSSGVASGAVLINPEGDGNVGVHVVSSPTHPLTVNGKIQSESGGYVFPDGTLQITAAGAGDPSLWTLIGLNVLNANNGNVLISEVDPGGGARNVPVRRLQVEDSAYQLRLVQTIAPNAAGLELVVGATLCGVVRATAVGIKLGVGDEDGVFVATGGTVGIGTESPQRNLHVVGNAASGGADNIQIRVESEVGYRSGVGLYQGTTFLGDVAADMTSIGLYVGNDKRPTRLGLALERNTDRLGVGLAAGLPVAAKLHVKGRTTDDIVLRLEAVDVVGMDQEVVADFYTNDGRMGLIVADPTYLRLANGIDNGCVKISQSTGFVVVAPPLGVDSGVGTTLGVDPVRRLHAVGTSAEDFQLALESPTAGGLELRTPSGVVASLRGSDTAVELSSVSGVLVYIDQATDAIGIGTVAPGAFALDVAGGRARGLESEEIGIIAQSLKKEFPELVSSWSDGDDTYYGVEYGRLTVVLLEAIKQLRGELCQMRKALAS
jgi:hypothetical protein